MNESIEYAINVLEESITCVWYDPIYDDLHVINIINFAMLYNCSPEYYGLIYIGAFN